MFEEQGEKKVSKEKKGIIKNKEVIAEYDEVLNSGEKNDAHLGKLEILKNKLGLSERGSSYSSDIKTNLIDDDVATFVDWKSGFSFFISYFLVLLILISGIFAYLTFLEKEEQKKVGIYDEDISKIKEEIINEESYVEEGIAFQKKIDNLEAIFNHHIYWSELFKYIEKNTYREVDFNEFSGETDGKYSFSAKADKAYFTATEQLKTFKEDEMTNKVDIPELKLVEDEEGSYVDFSLDLEVNPEIFYKKK